MRKRSLSLSLLLRLLYRVVVFSTLEERSFCAQSCWWWCSFLKTLRIIPLSLFLSLSNRIESRRCCLLTKKRSSLSSNRRRRNIMAKYYPDIAKGAKGKETLFFFALSSRFITIARRSIGFDLSLSVVRQRHTTDHKCNALDTSFLCTKQTYSPAA